MAVGRVVRVVYGSGNSLGEVSVYLQRSREVWMNEELLKYGWAAEDAIANAIGLLKPKYQTASEIQSFSSPELEGFHMIRDDGKWVKTAVFTSRLKEGIAMKLEPDGN